MQQTVERTMEAQLLPHAMTQVFVKQLQDDAAAGREPWRRETSGNEAGADHVGEKESGPSAESRVVMEARRGGEVTVGDRTAKSVQRDT